MRFEIERERLLPALQSIIGVVERRQTLPILGNVRVEATDGAIRLTATDLEVELVATAPAEEADGGATTLPARKLLDIVRNLPEGARIRGERDGERMTVRAGRSRFSLATLPAEEFPSLEGLGESESVSLAEGELRRLIERTHFSMAVQDVRYYLNGLLVELAPGEARMVATDGHRLALAETEVRLALEGPRQVIVPRKGVQELLRLLGSGDDAVELTLGESHVRVEVGDVRMTSKLIDGRFPDYRRVIPEGGDKRVRVDREMLRQALVRVSILSNEKYRGVRFVVGEAGLRVVSQNPEHEEAEEELEVEREGGPIEVGFNASYVLDALGVIEEETVEMVLSDPNSSGLLYGVGATGSRYVVMPMRL